MNKLNYILSNFSVFNNIKHINNGGCGIFAEGLYYTLKKLNLKPKLVLLTTNAEEANITIKNNHKNIPLHYNIHIMVYVNGKYIDISGIKDKVYIDSFRFGYSKAYPIKDLPIELLREWNKIEDNWNERFDRSNIKKILTGMNKIVNKYNKEYLVN